MTSQAPAQGERPGAEPPAPFAGSSLPGFVWATDRALRLRWLAGPADRLRVHPEAAAGCELFEAVPMGRAEGIAASAHRRAFDGHAANFEFGFAGRTYEARVEPDADGAVAIAVDVTDRRREDGERIEADAGFRHLVERVPAITYTAEFGASGTWRYVSPQVETILGFTAGEWVADPELFYSRVHTEDRGDYLEAEEQAHARGRLRCQYRLLARDGHVVWMRDEAVVVAATTERPAILQGVMLDVTDQVRAEEALRESELRYRRLVDMSPDAILVHRQGRFVFANPAAARLLGASDPRELVGLPILDIVHPDFHDLVAERARGAHEGRPAPLLEEVFVRRDGTPIDVEVAGIPFVFEGRPAGQIVVRDISERTAADRRIRAAERRYRTLVEALPMVTYVVERGEHGLTRYVSPQIERLVGYTIEECMWGREVWHRILHPDDRERVLAEDAEHERTEEPFSSEYRVVTKEGRVVWVRNEAVLLREEDGTASSWQGVMIDVTDRKRAEDELRRALEIEREAGDRLRAIDEMKNTFLHAVSHELRTPLSAVLGFALTLERPDLDLPADEARDIAGRIAANARKLERLLTDLLDLDRLDRGIVEPVLHRVDLAELAHRVVRESELPSRRAVEVDTESVTVALDAAKVERIVENLLANAIRHTPAGSRVWVRVRKVVDGALLCVEDDGPGVPDDMVESVFAPFVRGPAAPTHSPGVGVGLSLVGRFAELHGGRAWVQDRTGGGASFRVFLPRGEAAEG